MIYLQNLLDDVVGDEYAEDAFAGHYEEVHRGHVAEQFDRAHNVRRDSSTSCRKFHHKPTQQPIQLGLYVSVTSYSSRSYHIVSVLWAQATASIYPHLYLYITK